MWYALLGHKHGKEAAMNYGRKARQMATSDQLVVALHDVDAISA
jgi:hypothetical protein